jgi:DNA-binding NarL/FixJ family response regulator
MASLLLIEDEPAMRDNLMTILTLEGFRVTPAASGEEGLLQARASLPDLVLCDVTMPGLDGYDVLREFRRDALLADTPFLFLTAHNLPADMRRGMNEGADDYITKPFEVEDLLSAIRARLDRFNVLRKSAAAQPPPPARLQRLGLTSREAEVLHWLAEGKTNPEIAVILNIAAPTVKKHVEHILEKLGVENRAAAMRLVFGEGGAA